MLLTVCYELGYDTYQVAHWTASDLAEWVAFFQLRDESIAKVRGKKHAFDSDTSILIPAKYNPSEVVRNQRRRETARDRYHKRKEARVSTRRPGETGIIHEAEE